MVGTPVDGGDKDSEGDGADKDSSCVVARPSTRTRSWPSTGTRSPGPSTLRRPNRSTTASGRLVDRLRTNHAPAACSTWPARREITVSSSPRQTVQSAERPNVSTSPGATSCRAPSTVTSKDIDAFSHGEGLPSHRRPVFCSLSGVTRRWLRRPATRAGSAVLTVVVLAGVLVVSVGIGYGVTRTALGDGSACLGRGHTVVHANGETRQVDAEVSGQLATGQEGLTCVRLPDGQIAA